MGEEEGEMGPHTPPPIWDPRNPNGRRGGGGGGLQWTHLSILKE